jgi:hypothetical protein
MEFHTYKLKEERSYEVALKNMHCSINTDTDTDPCGKLKTFMSINIDIILIPEMHF